MNLVLRQDDDIWVKDGWYERFGMDADDYGREDTAEKMRAMPKTDINEMMDYYRSAREGYAGASWMRCLLRIWTRLFTIRVGRLRLAALGFGGTSWSRRRSIWGRSHICEA